MGTDGDRRRADGFDSASSALALEESPPPALSAAADSFADPVIDVEPRANPLPSFGEFEPAAGEVLPVRRFRPAAPTAVRADPAPRRALAAVPAPAPAVDELRREPVAEILPLTVAQRGMWIGHKINAAGTVFNVAEAIEIHGRVEPELFIAALRRVASEVDALRANIVEDAEGPHQVIHPAYRGPLPFVDCSASADPEGEARAFMMRDVETALDLEADPLWFCALIKVAPDRFFWHHRAHHIVYDGFSGAIVARRIAAIYNAGLAGQAAPPNPFAPLRAMVEDERVYRSSKAFERDKAYWRERLADIPPAVTFAHGRKPSGNGLLRETARLSSVETQALRNLAAGYSCTMPTILVALAAAFIHRTTGVNDLVFGTPVSARTKLTRAVPGMAANAVLIRLAMSGDLGLEAVARLAGRAMQGALRRQQYRIEDVRRDLGFTGADQYLDMARLAVNIEPFDYRLEIGGCRTTAHNLANASVEDLVVFIYDRDDGEGLRIDLDANPSLYSAGDLGAHMRRFLTLIRAMIADPQRSIGSIDLLAPEERRRLLVDFNCNARPYVNEPAFSQFERQAALTPNAPAVRFRGQTLTYRDADAQANRLARALIEAGAGAGDVVALALPRSAHSIVAMLGVHKAGAAFLPLDLKFPEARLRLLCADAGVKAVVTTAADAAGMPAFGAPLIAIDGLKARRNDDDAVTNAERLRGQAQSDPAYVIYTSGSTGSPKGVVVSHENLASMFAGMADILAFRPEHRLLSVINATFDPMIMESLMPLLGGALVVVAPPEAVREPTKLAELMLAERITHLQATPALWDALVATRMAPLSGVFAMSGGDALPGRLARAITGLGARLVNLYGPTETTIWSAAAEIGADERGTPAIGRPIANTRLYVLDDGMRLAPQGIVGELCIGGPGVAQGYLNRPDLTAERFLPDPFSAGGRLYRTGDLARWRADGGLEFHGRRDSQVKIRGYRIEPGEVEAALLDCEGVAAAVVESIDDAKGAKRLAAWVTPKPGALLDPDTLRSRLGRTLPDYMTPAHIALLDALPLTPSGKIDRKALPRPTASQAKAFIAPRNATERTLSAIFTEMLGVERVGVEDNFFEMGADSLTAVQLLAEIECRFSTKLSLVSLFDAPTIANLARQLDGAEARDPFAPVVTLRAGDGARPLFCIHSIVGFAWNYAGLLKHLNPRVPVIGLQAVGLSEEGALPASIDAMASDYLARIREVQPTGPYRLMGWSLGGLVAFAIAERLEAEGETVEHLALLDAYAFTGEAPPAGDETAFATAALNFIGYQPGAEIAGARTLDELSEFVLKEFDIFSMPLVRQARLDDPRLREAFRRVILNNFRIVQTWRPGVVRAPTLVVRARDGKDARLDGVIAHRPGAWSPHCRGRMEERDVACHHYQMMNPDALDTIGPLIREALA